MVRSSVWTLAVLSLFVGAVPASAAERQTIGFGRLFTNDFFGDQKDRWRSGSYSFSLVRGPEWTGRPPERFGALLEYRFRNEVIAPSSLGDVGNEDRPLVAALSAGVHTHMSRGAYDLRVGADLIAVGPQTGVTDAMDWFHAVIDAPRPAVAETQLPDAFYLDVSGELSRTTRPSERASVRYFVEGQAGTEDLLRAGVDVVLGPIVHGDLLIRDLPTGHLYRGTEGPDPGVAFTFGGDVAQVWDSEWLPEDRGVTASNTRYRLRAGVHWQIATDVGFFYGVTYLSEEFEDQDEGQLTGSLKLNFNF